MISLNKKIIFLFGIFFCLVHFDLPAQRLLRHGKKTGIPTTTASESVPIPPSEFAQPTEPVAQLIEEKKTPLPEPKTIECKITSPLKNEVLNQSNIEVFIETSASPDVTEKMNFHVIVDNNPPIVHEDVRFPLAIKNLTDGAHLVRVIGVHKGTGLSYPGAYAITRFFIRKKDFKNLVELDIPYLTVNLPLDGQILFEDTTDAFLEFFIQNAPEDLKNQLHVRYTLDRQVFLLNSLLPVCWKDLAQGRHELIVELINVSGTPILGPFNRVERKFEIVQVMKPLPAGAKKQRQRDWQHPEMGD